MISWKESVADSKRFVTLLEGRRITPFLEII